jgi:hypothetical protein
MTTQDDDDFDVIIDQIVDDRCPVRLRDWLLSGTSLNSWVPPLPDFAVRQGWLS